MKTWWRWIAAVWIVGGIVAILIQRSSSTSTSSSSEEENGGWLSRLRDRIDGWGLFGEAELSLPDPAPAALRSAFVWPTLLVMAPWAYLWPGTWLRVQRDFSSVGLRLKKVFGV